MSVRGEDGLGTLWVLVSAAAYGSMPIVTKFIYAQGLTPAQLLAWRFLIALAVFAVLRRSGEPPLPWRARAKLWGLGLVFVGNASLYFNALTSAPASTVSLVLYTYPVIVTLLSALLGLERLTLRGLAAAALAFGGCALTAGGPLDTLAPGIWLALAAAFVYASYIVLGSRFASGIPAEAAARHVVHVCVAVYAGSAALAGTLDPPRRLATWALLFVLGAVCTVVALRAFLHGLERIGPARASVLSSVEVLVTIGLAVAFLGEPVGPRQLLGGTLILAGVVLQHAGALWRMRKAER